MSVGEEGIEVSVSLPSVFILDENFTAFAAVIVMRVLIFG